MSCRLKPMRILVLAIAIGLAPAGLESVSAAISIEDFVKAKKKWPSQLGLRQVIEGRYAVTGRTLLKFHHCQLEFRSTQPLPKLTRRNSRDVNVQVVGRLRREGRKLYFQIERVSKQDDDLKLYQRRRPTGPKAKPADWFALADWASGQGSFYKDEQLAEKSTEANRAGVSLARRQAQGDLKALRQVARLVVTRGAGLPLQQAIEHEALRWELKAAGGKTPELEALRDRIGKGWPGSSETKNTPGAPLADRYRADPVAVYDLASGPDRLRLHRLLYSDLVIALITRRARAEGTSGYTVAEAIRRAVPEATVEAARWDRMALDLDLKRSATMGRSELDRLLARLKAARREPEATAAVDGWLESRREKLLSEGVAGRLRWADLVLSLKGDRRGAVVALIEADRLKPDDREVAERLDQLGYSKQDGKWVRVSQGTMRIPRRVAVPTGVRVGMSGKQLLAAMGAPRRITRSATRQSFSEIWVYGEPGSSRVAVHLIRSRDGGESAVRAISQLRSRR
jgi:hypothetical protein